MVESAQDDQVERALEQFDAFSHFHYPSK